MTNPQYLTAEEVREYNAQKRLQDLKRTVAYHENELTTIYGALEDVLQALIVGDVSEATQQVQSLLGSYHGV